MLLDAKQTEIILNKLHQQYSKPETKLKYNNPFTFLIAIMLSAQTKDIIVNKVTTALFIRYNTPQKMLTLKEEKIREYIKSVGLYNKKAKFILGISQILFEKYNNKVPINLQALLKLPGIGRKTANVFLNYLYKEKKIGVDTHVLRISNRIGLCTTKTPFATEKALMKSIPKMWIHLINYLFVTHGRDVCKARNPECNTCIIKKECQFYINK